MIPTTTYYEKDSKSLNKLIFKPEKEIIKLNSFLNSLRKGASNDLIITANRGAGKTTLLKLLKEESDDDIIFIYLNCTNLFIENKGNIEINIFLEYILESMIKAVAEVLDKDIKLDNFKEKILADFERKEKSEEKIHDKQLKFKLSEENDYQLFLNYNKEFEAICKKLGFPLSDAKIDPEKVDSIDYIEGLNFLFGSKNQSIPVTKPKKEDLIILKKFISTFSNRFLMKYKKKYSSMVIIIDDFQLITNSNNLKELLECVNIENDKIMTLISTTTPYSEIINLKSKHSDNQFLIDLIPIKLNPLSELELKIYLMNNFPDLNFTKNAFKVFYNLTKGYLSNVNSFLNNMNLSKDYNDKLIIKNYKERIDDISINWIMIWSTLSNQEKEIVIKLVDLGQMRWTDLLNNTDFSRATMNKYLDFLVKKSIVKKHENKYEVEDQILKTWLIHVKNKTGYYPIYYI